ncbi:MAG: porin family protein [Bacteroidota bacterium]
MKGKQIFLTCICLIGLGLSSNLLQAQKFGRHEFDMKWFNLGFQVGLNYNTYALDESILVRDPFVNTVLDHIELRPQIGLRLSIISNLNLTDNLALRLIPGVSLEQRNFKYFFENGVVEDRKVEATYFYLPLLLQFKSDYYNKGRFYLQTGGQFGLNFASNKKVRDDFRLLKINRQDVALVIAVGFTLYGEKIKLSPEISYSIGLNNIYEPEFTTHPDAIRSLRSQVLAFIINFE